MMSDDESSSDGEDRGSGSTRQPQAEPESTATFAPTASSLATAAAPSPPTTAEPQIERVSLEQLGKEPVKQEKKQLYTVLPGL